MERRILLGSGWLPEDVPRKNHPIRIHEVFTSPVIKLFTSAPDIPLKIMKKILAIDGHALSYRAYYAMAAQNLTNKDGIPTGAVMGFFRNIATMAKVIRPDFLVFVFDPSKKNFRHEIFPEYKSNRKPTPDDLKIQIEEIQSIIRNLELPLWIPENEEADDALASLATSIHGQKEYTLYLATADKDLMAILGDNVFMLRAGYKTGDYEILDTEYPKKKWGIPHDRIMDFLALMGDSSDFIPGVKGIGEKGAAALVAQFGSLEEIYENLDKISAKAVAKKLEDDRDNAFLSRDLVRLKTDIKVPFNFTKMDRWVNPSLEKKIRIFKEKEIQSVYNDFEKLFRSYPVEQKSPAKVKDSGNKEAADMVSPPYLDEGLFGALEDSLDKRIERYALATRIIRKKADWDVCEQEIRNLENPEISVDTETTSKSPMEASLVGISIAYYHPSGGLVMENGSNIKLLYIPATFSRPESIHPDYADVDDGPILLEALREVLEDESIIKIGQNIKYDMLVLQNHGIDLKGIRYDTMILSYLKNPEKREHNLDDLAAKYLGETTIEYKEITGTGKKTIPLVEIPLRTLSAYAGEDAGIALRLKDILVPETEKSGLMDLYRNIDLPFIYVLNKMEKNGCLVDREYLKKMSVDFTEKISILEKKIYEAAGRSFNLNSPQQLASVLYDELGLDMKKKTSGGKASTDASVLELLKGEHEVVDRMLEYRLANKLLGTYIDPLPGYIVSSTGRIHSSFSPVVAATGRITSSNPNLQNIPIKEEEGRQIRRAFIAEEGFSLLVFDYSQIELRILAHYSGDTNLTDAFLHGEDIHDKAAYLLYRRFFDETKNAWSEDIIHPGVIPDIDPQILAQMKQTPEFSRMRSKAKILNFSIVYGVTDFGLSNSMKISRAEAKSLISLYFEMFPGIRKYMENAEKSAREKGFSENYFGRRRYIPELSSSSHNMREAGRRLAINTPIQSTAADLIKVAMIDIQKMLEKRGSKTRMILQIHDELIFEVPEGEKEEVFVEIKKIMETCVEFRVPLVVSGGYGRNWDEAK